MTALILGGGFIGLEFAQTMQRFRRLTGWVPHIASLVPRFRYGLQFPKPSV
jgi:hypothetical protein